MKSKLDMKRILHRSTQSKIYPNIPNKSQSVKIFKFTRHSLKLVHGTRNPATLRHGTLAFRILELRIHDPKPRTLRTELATWILSILRPATDPHHRLYIVYKLTIFLYKSQSLWGFGSLYRFGYHFISDRQK